MIDSSRVKWVSALELLLWHIIVSFLIWVLKQKQANTQHVSLEASCECVCWWTTAHSSRVLRARERSTVCQEKRNSLSRLLETSSEDTHWMCYGTAHTHINIESLRTSIALLNSSSILSLMGCYIITQPPEILDSRWSVSTFWGLFFSDV